jgi:hypothetical protein
MKPKLITPNHQLILSDEAKRELAQAGEKRIEGYLVGLSQQVSIYNEHLDLVLKEALRERNMPVAEEDRQLLINQCSMLADDLTHHKLERYHLQVKALVHEMGVKSIPPETLWAARRVGVELLDTDASEPH